MNYDAKNMIQQIGANFLTQAAVATEKRDYCTALEKAKKGRKKRPCFETHQARLNSILNPA